MTDARIIDFIANIEKTLDRNQKAAYASAKGYDEKLLGNLLRGTPEGLPFLLELFRREAESSIKSAKARKAGTADAIKAAANIINQMRPDDDRRGIVKPDADHVLIGGLFSVVLRESIPELDLPEAKRSMFEQYSKFLAGARENAENRMEAPTLKEIKDYIKIDKAAHRGQKRYKPGYDFGDGLPLVDAELYKDIIILLGEDVSVYAARKNPMLSPVYFVSPLGEGILLPVRKMENRKEA